MSTALTLPAFCPGLSLLCQAPLGIHKGPGQVQFCHVLAETAVPGTSVLAKMWPVTASLQGPAGAWWFCASPL